VTTGYAGSMALVIDASVLQSAGETEHPVSSACREFLERVQRARLAVISTPELKEERNRHRSRYSSRWFSKMAATKRMVYVADPTDPTLRRHLSECAEQRSENPEQEANLAGALTKDACLVEASNACDKAPISSLDDRMRDHPRACAPWVPEVRHVVWVNPTNADEMPLDWLDSGAPRAPERMLAL